MYVIAWLIRDDRLLISIRNSFFSGSPFGQSSKVKRAQLGVVSGWVIDREVSPGCARLRTKSQKRLVLICRASLHPAKSNDHRRVCLRRYKLISEPTLAVTRMVADRCVVMLFMTFVTRRGTRHGTCTKLDAQTYVPRGNVLWPDEDVRSSEWGCM